MSTPKKTKASAAPAKFGRASVVVPVAETAPVATAGSASAAPAIAAPAAGSASAAPAPTLDPQQQNEREALDSLMQELVGVVNARVTVWRATRNQPTAYMFQCSPDAFSLDELRDKYNGGEFRLYVTRDGVCIRNLRISVEPKITEAPAAPSATVDLLIAIRDGFDRQAQVMRDTLAQAHRTDAAPVGQWLTNLPQLITSCAAAIATLRPPLPPPSAPLPAAALNETKAVDLILKGIELARELAPAGGDGDIGLMTLLRDLLRSPMLAQAVAASQRQPQRPLAPRPGVPAPATIAAPVAMTTAPVPPAPAGQVHPDEAEPMVLIKQYLRVLCERAAEGSDPTLYADLVLDNVPEDTVRQLLAREPDPVSALVADWPPFAAHRDWLGRMVGAVVGVLNGPPGGQFDGLNGSGVEAGSAVSDRSPADAVGPDAPVVSRGTSRH